MLMTIAEATQRIEHNDILLLAGEETLLRQLPKGRWIGGSIPYFMTEQGGLMSKTHLFANEMPYYIQEVTLKYYDEYSLDTIPSDAPDNGFSVIIMPATSRVHVAYAQNAAGYKDIFLKPIIGWVCGVHMEELDKKTGKVFNGMTGEISDQLAIVMHLTLPMDKIALIGILNLFSPHEDDPITFEEEGFMIRDCFVNGKKRNLARYLLECKADLRCPLIADYCGALVNVGIRGIDAATRRVLLYAPVFRQVTYHLAKPVPDYISQFEQALPKDTIKPIFSCNCLLNYLHGELEGKKTAPFLGPITYGEVAYQFLNQTLVYLEIKQI